jgi:hypothetical protein
MSSFCVFGCGWIADLLRIPSYVAKYNKSPGYIKRLEADTILPEAGAKKKRRPPCCRCAVLSQLVTTMLLGMWYGLILSGCAPKTADPHAFIVLAYIGSCFGVYAGGNCISGGDVTGSILNIVLWSWWVPIVFRPRDVPIDYQYEEFQEIQENNYRAVWFLTALLGSIGYCRSRTYSPNLLPNAANGGDDNANGGANNGNGGGKASKHSKRTHCFRIYTPLTPRTTHLTRKVKGRTAPVSPACFAGC